MSGPSMRNLTRFAFAFFAGAIVAVSIHGWAGLALFLALMSVMSLEREEPKP